MGYSNLNTPNGTLFLLYFYNELWELPILGRTSVHQQSHEMLLRRDIYRAISILVS